LLVCAVPPASFAQQKGSDGEPSETLTKLIGHPAPDFTVSMLDGKQVSLSAFHGKVLLLNFWATWCGACKVEMPWLAQLREQHAFEGFEVLGVVTDGASDEKIKRVVDASGVKYPIAHCNHKTAQAFGGLPYLPTSFFIDRDGKVIVEFAEADSKAELEAIIRKALHPNTKERK
jgi:cytochrome c biogenesis protein CcmG/thiol:disulfide interchange protein DsbE